ncbi:hypothetical protein [Polaribacter sp.]|uniref:hypothetical protein n=1 Tax=Polaribacter sp. TaxID=1920175 RepID=UPI003EF72D78
MKKFILVLVILVSNQFVTAQNEAYIPEKKTQKAFGEIDFMSINLPKLDPNMGFTGIHYNLFLNDWSYAGVGIYGAVSGNKGGFFTLGVNAGIKKYLSDKIFVDAGIHFGGGGGAAAPDGGGAFILPHVNLGYNFENFSVTSGWSYVNFFDGGEIKSHQLNFGLEFPLDFEYTDYESLERELNIYDLKESDWNTEASKLSVMLHVNTLKIKGDTKDTNGNKYNGETIGLAGFEVASYLDKNWFGFVKVDGAFKGIKSGYMDVFLGAGYQLSFNKNRTNILAKFGVGAGGGGGVDTKGGFLIYPDISIEQKIFEDLYLSVNKGFVMSPDSHFLTSSFGVGIKYYTHKNGIISDDIIFSEGKLKGLEFIIKQDMYFNAKRDTNPTENLHQISLQINLDIAKNFYLAGQTSFANFGNAGAYAEGIVGLGVKTNPIFNQTTTFFTQVLGGAAGGGNISTGEGLIIKPSLGAEYKLINGLSLRTALGYVKADGGELSSLFVNLGIKYNFSFLKMN